MSLQVELVSPEQVAFSGEAEMVVCRTRGGGDIAFQPGHVPFVGSLVTAPVILFDAKGDKTYFAVHGGFVQLDEDRVAVLSDVCELQEEIDESRAQTALERAEAALAADAEDSEAAAAARRASVRLDVVRGAVAV